MAAALETVLKQLEDSGLISSGKLENFIPPKAHPKDADDLVRELVQQNVLSRRQQAENGTAKLQDRALRGKSPPGVRLRIACHPGSSSCV